MNMKVHMKFVSTRLGNVEILCKISEQIWSTGCTEEKVRRSPTQSELSCWDHEYLQKTDQTKPECDFLTVITVQK